jgi:predicted class III extradiol MEMO1 family dioxygenase
MKLIQEKNRNGFENYLKRTQNTICGRNPIKCNLKFDNSAVKFSSKEKLYD